MGAFDSFAGSRIARVARALLRGRVASNQAATSASSQRALDWFSFFLADIQTGFGPFVAVYLSANAWTQGEIGIVLTAGGLVALAGQMPAGALVDAIRSARGLAAFAIIAISISALALALWPVFPVVIGARVLHAGASCVLAPVIAGLSLAVAGHAGFGERLGRNARFASLGAGIAAAAMGACGQFLSTQSIFLLSAALALPAIFALAHIRPSTQETSPRRNVENVSEKVDDSAVATLGWRKVLTDRSLLVFAGCVVLFHLANAGMLPLMAGILASGGRGIATSTIAACMIVPQIAVVVASPFVGRKTEQWGRRPLLLICFAALAMRATLFALVSNPYAIIAIQLLDGVSAAVLGVIFPLIIADIARNTCRFNLALGAVGSAMGIGAALSTTLAGLLYDRVGAQVTFSLLGGIALLGLGLAWLAMAETRPQSSSS